MRALPQQQLDKRIIKVWKTSAFISAGITIVVLAIVVTLLTLFSPVPLWASLAGACAIVALEFILDFAVLPPIRYARWRYEVTDTEIDLLRGIFFKTRTIVPLVRVQHVESEQGPILRKNGLASINITTAGGQVEIPGLALDEADKLRDRVAVLARIAQEDV